MKNLIYISLLLSSCQGNILVTQYDGSLYVYSLIFIAYGTYLFTDDIGFFRGGWFGDCCFPSEKGKTTTPFKPSSQGSVNLG